MNRKRIIAVILTAAVAAGSVFGITKAVRATTSSGTVMVINGASLNYGGYYWNDSSMSGVVTSDAAQNVYLTDTETIREVYVTEGQSVKEGDLLLAYDVTQTTLGLEQERLNKQKIELNIEVAEANIATLQGLQPYVEPSDDVIIIPDDIPEEEEPTEEEKKEELKSMIEASQVDEELKKQLIDIIFSQDGDTDPEEDPDKNDQALTEEETEVIRKVIVQLIQSDEDADGKLALRLLKTLDAETLLDVIQQSAEKDPELRTKLMEAIQDQIPENPADDSGKENDPIPTETPEPSQTPELTPAPEAAPVPDQAQDSNLTQFSVSANASDAVLNFNETIHREYELAGFADCKKITVVNSLTAGSYSYGNSGGASGLIASNAQYSADELKRARIEEQQKLDELQLELRESELKIAQTEKAVNEGVVRAKMNGVVKTLKSVDNPPTDGSAFLTVAGTKGMYIQSAVSESNLSKLQEGDSVTITSWQSGYMYDAVVKEISPYPDTSGMFNYGESDSYYPFTAYIESDDVELANGEYLQVSMSMDSGFEEESSGGFYLYRAFIREEGEQKYVYIRGEDGKLKKQSVVVGTLSGEGYEILSGASMSDWFAFPYGNEVREGAKTREGSVDELYNY